jgi:hypothetical protein
MPGIVIGCNETEVVIGMKSRDDSDVGSKSERINIKLLQPAQLPTLLSDVNQFESC